MKKIYIIAFLLHTFHAVAAPDTTRVLFIGNSFTYVYDVPSLVKGFADAAGFPLVFTMHAPGGISVGDVDQGTEAHMRNPEVFDLIRSGGWDFVSLQDNQGRFVRGGGIFPDTAVSKVIEGHFKIRDSMRFYNPCARMLWFAGWAFKDGYPGISPTAQGLIDNIYYNYQYLKDTAGEIIAPIGKAWERSIDTLPAVDLWGPDGAHQSLAGSYVTAAVIFTSIFRVNIENINFTGGLDSATARTIRRLAYHTVVDSIAATNLTTFMPTLSATTSMVTSTTGYANYTWYRNGIEIGSGASNTFAISTGGCYQVVVTNADGCTMRSMQQCVDGEVPSSVTTTVADKIRIYPVPARDIINIELSGTIKMPIQLTISDMSGKIVDNIILKEHTTAIPVPDFPDGLYFITINTNSEISRAKMVIAH